MRWLRFRVEMLLLKRARNSRGKEGNRRPMTGFIPTFPLLMITGERMRGKRRGVAIYGGGRCSKVKKRSNKLNITHLPKLRITD